MGHERCFHTTSSVALALDGIQRMRDCLGASFDRHFVAALTDRLPGIAEQSRARNVSLRNARVYSDAFERPPARKSGPAESLARMRARPCTLPRLPVPRLTPGW